MLSFHISGEASLLLAVKMKRLCDQIADVIVKLNETVRTSNEASVLLGAQFT